jgi:uncharacterized protein (DUF58 family)
MGGGPSGERPSLRPGTGHELLTLRRFRPGDDHRSIHWKQTARTGDLIYMETEAEKGDRVSILLDNGVGELDPVADERFERVISEAATAAHHFLEQGYEVELITREGVVGFGRGAGQRRRILESLALIVAVDPSVSPLFGSDPDAPSLRFGLNGEQT